MMAMVILFCLVLTSNSQCGPNCHQCNSIMNSKCQKCVMGSYIDSSYTCNPCSDNCINCQEPQVCRNCDVGYGLIQGQCSPCPQFCASCGISKTPSSPFLYVCGACYSGYYLGKSYVCHPCIPACNICNDGSSCQACGYGLGFSEQKNECIPCPPYCAKCNDEKCISCQLTYYANDSGQCQKCSEGCLNCTKNVCTTCEQRYFISNGTCERCPQNCLKCQSDEHCYFCNAAYYVGDDDKTCEPCIDNCNQCDNSQTCSGCATGHYLSDLGSCALCGDNCLKCLSPYNCTTCQGTYYASEGICYPCRENCASCLGDYNCQLCSSVQFLIIDGVCTRCSEVWENCQTCSNVCLSCSDGYYLLSNWCYLNDDGLSTVWIVLIVLGCLLLAVGIGAGIWYFCKGRQGYGSVNGENNGIRASYYEMP